MFRFSPIFGSYWVVLGIVAALGIVLFTIRPGGQRLGIRGRRFLIFLRTVALLLLLFSMLRPTLVYTKTQRLSSTLNILLDRSESMSRSDEAAGNTRFHAAREALIDAQSRLKRLQEYSEVNGFMFDASLHPLTIRDGIVQDFPEKPQGRETAIGAALDTVRERSAGKRVLGTILLSDGNQRTRPPRDALPQDAAGRMRDAGIPLYAVRLGQAGASADVQDISVNDIQANDRVFVKNDLVINGTIRITGYRNQPIPVQLFFEDEQGKMQLVEEKTVRSVEDGQIVPYRFAYAPQHTGYFKYTVLIPPQPKELIDTNNQQSNFVRVIEGGLEVLFIHGEPLLEQGPLRQSLNASVDIQVQYRSLRVGRVKADEGSARQSFQRRLEQYTERRASWKDTEFAPEKYNVYILDGIDSKAFKTEELQALADRVREGSGLIMLGGLHAFGAGGYGRTPLADVIPVELRALDSQPLDGPIRRDIHWQGQIQMLPKEQGGRIHYVMQLVSDPAENETRWKSLPPLLGANKFGRIKGGATIIAEGPEGERLLVSHLAGLGRVLAFAGDSTYRWRTAGFVEEHKRFWRQIVLWLARMEGALEGDCWITLDNVRLIPGDTAKFQVFLKSSEGEELRNFKAEAFVGRPDGERQRVVLVDEDGIPTGSFRETELPGDYTIQVEVPVDSPDSENVVHHASARFMVFDRNLEMDNPVAFPRLLDNISATTGGYGIAPEQLGSLLDALIEKAESFEEKRETKKSLYDAWGLLLAFVVVMGTEWFFRKYWGLV